MAQHVFEVLFVMKASAMDSRMGSKYVVIKIFKINFNLQ